MVNKIKAVVPSIDEYGRVMVDGISLRALEKQEFEEKLITKAKEWLVKRYYPQIKNIDVDIRAWHEIYYDSYAEPANRFRVFIWEGSPIKGHIVLDRGRNRVIATDTQGKPKIFYI